MSPTPLARVIVTVNYQPTLRVFDNTAWCSCTKCAALLTNRECCCCRELAHLRHDVEGLQCVTDHPEFAGACLNPLTLRIALVGAMETRGDPIHLPISNR